MRYIPVLFLITCMTVQAQRTKMNYGLGDSFPEFTLNTIDNKTIDLTDLKGKVVFLNAWFIKCKPCVEEMPELNKLQEKYKDQVTFISMSLDSKDEIQNFLKKHKYNFKHLADAKDFLEKTLGNKTFPKNIIIGKSGEIKYISSGLPYKRIEGSDELTMLDYTFFEKPLKEVIDGVR